MKQFTSSLFCSLILFFLTTPVMGAANPWDVKLPFKNATIKYQISGSENGTETLYVRDYGKETARYRKTTSKIMFMTTNTDTIEISTPDWIYQIDLQERTGTKSVNPVKYMIEEYNKLSKSDQKKLMKNLEKKGQAAMSGIQGEVTQNATKILGFKCDKVTAMGSTMYTIHGTGITLKSDTAMAGMNFSSVATDLDKGGVADTVFAVPAGIAVEHDPQADQAARSMAGQTIAWLLDPESGHPAMNMGNVPAGEYGGSEEPPVSGGESDPDMDKAMQQGMDALRGLFGK